MSVIDSTEFPTLAAPRRPEGPTSCGNRCATCARMRWPRTRRRISAADIITQRILWRRMFIINEPGAIRYVLLDNAANYTKSEVGRRLLEPGLGRGLLTSEGETWRRHRRIMAPSFDPRSIVGYAPIMTDVTRGLAGKVGRAAGAAANSMSPRTMMHVDAPHHLARDVLLRFRRDRRCRRGRRQPVSNSGAAEPARPAALPAMARAADLRRCRRTGSSTSSIQKVDRLLTERGRTPDAEPKDLLARLDRRARQRDRRRHDGEGSARPGRHHLHGRARDHVAGAVVDLVSAVAASGSRKPSSTPSSRTCSAAARRVTTISPIFATPAW